MSAVFKAGLSFTPSPVIATISPFFCHAFTILTLCSGLTLAYTLYFLTFCSNSSSVIFSSSLPVIASSSFSSIPSFLAIAIAVILWSPVIITVFIPAFLHFSTAFFASSLGGSIIPAIPTYIRSVSMFFISSFVGLWSNSLYPNANTLNASFAISSFFCSICFLYSFIFSCIFPSIIYELHLFKSSSTPPFVYTKYLFPIWWTVVISFLSESNGSSSTLSNCSYIDGSNASLKPISTNAVSVGSPAKVLFVVIFVSLQSIAIWTNLSRSAILVMSVSAFSNVSMSISSLSVYIFCTVILFCVNVPVLSEHTIDVLPKVSTAGRLFIIAFFLTILCTLKARTTVTTVANPSGIAATANAIAVLNASKTVKPDSISIKKTTMQITIHITPILFPIWSNWSWSGVFWFLVCCSIVAILPTSLSSPVVVTNATPRP